jgi:hypothetical protein
MDGVMVPVGRGWRAAKVGEVYCRGKRGGVERIRYYATISDSKRFGRRMRTVAQAEGWDLARERALLGDGAEWLWQAGAKRFPQATEIVDLFRVLEYLWALARARFPAAGAARKWVDQQQQRLLKNEVKQGIAAVAAWEPEGEAAAELKRRTEPYLRGQAHRMAYETCQEQGFHLGSGCGPSRRER